MATFHGPDITPSDEQRLTRQLDRVKDYALKHEAMTLAEIAHACNCSENSASARLRDLRKPENGGWIVLRERKSTGIFAYTVKVPPPPTAVQLPLGIEVNQ